MVIAGGGLVGLSTAMFLARHGVASVAIERLREGSPLPRAAHFHVRTFELFRAAGIEEAVKEQSAREFLPEGAIVAMDSLAGRKLADIIPSINIGVDDTLSPCRRLFVTQPGLEPILRRQAHAAGAEVLEGHEVVGVEQDDDGVTVTARDVDSGAEVTQRAGYLVAADGAHSVVRDSLGIPFEGRGTFSNSITIYFTADLWPQMGGKPLSVIYINNPAFGGFFRLSKDCQSGFLVVNTVGDPSAGAASDAAADTSEARLVELVRIGTGVRDLVVRIDGLARWRASTDVAGSLPGRPDLPGRRRRPRDAAQRRVRWQHRHRGRVRRGLEAGAGCQGRGWPWPSRHLRAGASAGRPAHGRAGLRPVRHPHRDVPRGHRSPARPPRPRGRAGVRLPLVRRLEWGRRR